MQSLRKTELQFQIWHEEFGEFDPTTQKFEDFFLMGSFCIKYTKF